MVRVVAAVQAIPLLAANFNTLAPAPRSITELAVSLSVPSCSLKPPVWSVPPPRVIGTASPIWLDAPRRRVPPALTIRLPLGTAATPAVLLNCSVPPLTVVLPLGLVLPYVFALAPLSTSVPGPFLVSPAVLLMIPEKVVTLLLTEMLLATPLLAPTST